MNSTTPATAVELYEDNAGAVYLHRPDLAQTWALGPVTPDMEGNFGTDAQAWLTGQWEPSDADGQTATDLNGLQHIATWDGDAITLETTPSGDVHAGAGGSAYLGLPD